MKSVLFILKYIGYFVIGNIIFNFIFASTQAVILNMLGLQENFFEIYISEFYNNLLIYSILFFIILFLNLIYNMVITKKLNKKLEKAKERSKEDEK